MSFVEFTVYDELGNPDVYDELTRLLVERADTRVHTVVLSGRAWGKTVARHRWAELQAARVEPKGACSAWPPLVQVGRVL